MTPTYPTAGTPAARRADAWRPLSTVRAAVALVAALLVLFVGGAPAFAGVTTADGAPVLAAATPSPSPSPLSGELTLTLAPGANGLVGPGADLSASITVFNGTDRAVTGRTATLFLGTTAISDRSALSDWLSGDSTVDVEPVSSVAVDAVVSGGDATAVARADAGSPPLQNRAPGVYPLLVRTSGSDESLSARSVIVVPSDAAATVPVGVVVPVTAGPLGEGLLTSDQLAELTAADGLLTATLDAVAGTPAILAVDPAIAAAIRVLGSAAPETASAWLDRLLRLPNERFALQFGDADLSAQIAAGVAPLQPATLQPYMDVADFAQTADPQVPTPAETEGAAGPVLPDLATLLDIGATRQNVYWPVTGTADTDTVATLGAPAADGQPTLTLLASASTDAGADDRAIAAAQQAGEASLLVYDSAVSAALRDAAVLPDSAGRGGPLAAATAYLALSGAGSAPLLVVVDRADDITRVGVRAAIAAATQAPGAVPATLAELIEAAPGAVRVVGGSPDAGRVAAVSALVSDEQSLATFSSILDDPTVLLAPERAEIIQLLGAGWVPVPELWAAALAGHRTGSGVTLDAVGILPPTTTNLISSGAGLGFWVRNDLPWPVNVRLTASPDDVRLEVENLTDVRAEAASNKRVEVPVQARLGNGEVTIALALSSPSGIPIGTAQQVDVNVRAELEGVGVVILSVVVGGLIVVGLVRTVLHRRWVKRHPQAPAGEAAA